MGFFNFLRGIKTPDPSTPVVSLEQTKANILALNRETAPYQIRDGKEEGVDLIAEWKIVDAKWYEVFNKAGLKKVFKILMVLDDLKKEVRTLDKSFDLAWSAGIPSISATVEVFRGQKMEVSGGMGYAFTEELKPGVVYRYRFNTGEMKKPLDEAILNSGWSIKKVAFSKLK
ncbi:MAG: hypothetical protein Q8P27_01750 [Candidatus Peregrinibacteria bacterium]|nr:hypothetical protein [Candidatus Peregrinibacteria bacterium]